MNASKAKNFHHMDCLKKNLLLAFALTFTLSLMAVPARRGIWRMLTLVDGTQVRAQLVGDEYAHYYRSADGNAYLYDETADAYRKTEPTTLRQQGMRRRTLAGTAARQALVADKATATQAMTGNKRALIILAEFQDQKFADQYYNYTTGKISNLFGFELYTFANMPRFSTAGVRQAVDASTGNQASVAFYVPRVFRATGSTKMYYSASQTDPLNKRNLMSFTQYFVCLPKKADAFGAIYSAAGA